MNGTWQRTISLMTCPQSHTLFALHQTAMMMNITRFQIGSGDLIFVWFLVRMGTESTAFLGTLDMGTMRLKHPMGKLLTWAIYILIVSSTIFIQHITEKARIKKIREIDDIWIFRQFVIICKGKQLHADTSALRDLRVTSYVSAWFDVLFMHLSNDWPTGTGTKMDAYSLIWARCGSLSTKQPRKMGVLRYGLSACFVNY